VIKKKCVISLAERLILENAKCNQDEYIQGFETYKVGKIIMENKTIRTMARQGHAGQGSDRIFDAFEIVRLQKKQKTQRYC
jgi:hypothetical protein